MDEKLIPEIEAILHRYNSLKEVEFYHDPLNFTEDPPDSILLEDFEEKINWYWVIKNYHVSHTFIYEYQDKLNMKYLYDNYVITKEGFEKICKREIVDNRFELMDL